MATGLPSAKIGARFLGSIDEQASPRPRSTLRKCWRPNRWRASVSSMSGPAADYPRSSHAGSVPRRCRLTWTHNQWPRLRYCARRFPEYVDTWTIEHGSALDREYLNGLGQFDIVYSWGVLHHSGSMWEAMDNLCLPVKEGGRLWVALYNDQGWISEYWLRVKRSYNQNLFLRTLMIAVHSPYLLGLRILVRLARGQIRLERGMSLWHDMLIGLADIRSRRRRLTRLSRSMKIVTFVW